MEKQFYYQTISIAVPSSGASVSVEATTQNGYERVVGIAHTNNSAACLEGSYFDKFEIDSQEIFPSGFEAKLLHSSTDVAPNQRYLTKFDQVKGDKLKVAIKYVDGGKGATGEGTTDYPYVAKIVLMLTNAENC